MSLGSFKDVKMCLQIIYICYMYKENLALINLKWLIYQTKPNQTKQMKL